MIHVIPQHYKGTIGSVAEIGSAHGMDADFLAKSYGVPAGMVHIVEPRPDAAEYIRTTFSNYHTHQIVCGKNNQKGNEFHISAHLEGSSLRDRAIEGEKWLHHSKILVDLWRWEDYVDSHGLPIFDLVKVDAEGCTHEVLRGFGRYRDTVKVYHLECEDIEFWKGQKMLKDVVELMPEYEVVWKHGNGQYDVIMVHKDHRKDWNDLHQ